MKRILFLASILLSAIVSTAQEDRRLTLAESNLQGAVRSASETTYDGVEKFGEVEKGKKIAKVYLEYTNAGYLLESLDENYEHKYKMSATNKFDNRNNIVEQKTEEDGEVMTVKLKYNEKDKEEEMNIYDKKGKLLWKHKTRYSAEHIEMSSTQFIFPTTTDVYNGEGKLEKQISYMQDRTKTVYAKDKNTESESMERDSKGNIIKKIFKNNNDKDSIVYKYKYNNKNQKTELVYISSRSGTPTTYNYEYDQYGNIAKETDSYGNKRTYTYIYDSQNNWIKRIEKKLSFGDDTIEITERTIRYY